VASSVNQRNRITVWLREKPLQLLKGWRTQNIILWDAVTCTKPLTTTAPWSISLVTSPWQMSRNPRLARIKERTLWWNFKILHTPDKKQLAADAISRRNKLPAALHKVSITEESALSDIVVVLKSVRGKVKAVMKSNDIKVITWDRLYEATGGSCNGSTGGDGVSSIPTMQL
jgi:hypothetical protein